MPHSDQTTVMKATLVAVRGYRGQKGKGAEADEDVTGYNLIQEEKIYERYKFFNLQIYYLYVNKISRGYKEDIGEISFPQWCRQTFSQKCEF